MAHGLELKAICKTMDNSKGLGGLLFAIPCLFGEGTNREGKKEEKLADSNKVGKCCCEHTAL